MSVSSAPRRQLRLPALRHRQAQAARAHGVQGRVGGLQHRIESGPRRSPHPRRHGKGNHSRNGSARKIQARQTVERNYGRAALLRRPDFRAERQLCPTMLDAGRAERRAGERARPGCSQRRPRRWHSWAGDCTISFIASKMFAARARRTTREARVLPGSPANWSSSILIIATSAPKSASNFKSCAIRVCYCTSSAASGVCLNSLFRSGSLA